MRTQSFIDKDFNRIETLKEELHEMQDIIERQGIAVFDGKQRPDARKRLFARCYWFVFQDFLFKYNISQRRLCNALHKQPSTIAQMIHRNTFPSPAFETTVLNYLSGLHSYNASYMSDLDGLKRNKTIPYFFRLDVNTVNEVLCKYEGTENDEVLDLRKTVTRHLTDLSESELREVKRYIEWLKSQR